MAGQPLVARQARLLLALQPACVIVVTGAVEKEVRQALAGLEVEWAHHEDWSHGMGQSIARGIAAMPERVSGALLLLCDQWRVDRHDLEELIDAWANDPQKAVVSAWDGFSGPPTIFPRALFQRLAGLQGDQGARHLLKRSAGGVLRVPIANAAFDLDKPGDSDPEMQVK